MGVPKFYRWISERYPCLSEVVKEHQVPEFDNLYLDMNGIIHNCSHPNDEDPHFRITEEQIFCDIFHYIEVLFRIVRPRRTFFMAVDGVAPRAKMNQQRGRRFRSAKDAEERIQLALKKGEVLPTEKRFDSNCITPGTKFMEKLQTQLEYFVQNKITYDQAWQGIRVYLSGHQAPGEGEHKIMEFIRYERSQPGYDPNVRHCLYGLDADLMILALCSHEPHFALLREEVRFTKQKNDKKTAKAEETTFHLLHISLMREYIDHEFESLKETLAFPYNLESIIDDWVLMGFLVGNDFIPHLPDMHINSNALPMLYQTYMNVLPTLEGYINEGGVINLRRFQAYLKELSSFDEEHFEEIYEDYKWLESRKKSSQKTDDQINVTSPSKEKSIQIVKDLAISQGVYSLSDADSQDEDENLETDPFYREFKAHKKHYYSEKFQVSPSDEQIQCIAFEYVLGLQWICHYYFNGVQSWSWYYPYHYSPYVSDLKKVSEMKLRLKMNKPFQPFEQLLAVLPAASKDCIPEAYWHLMEEGTSEIGDFYPTDFSTDLNGKKQEWEAVVIIPFIDETRLLKAMEPCFKNLSKEERVRNKHGPCQLYTHAPSSPHFVKSTLPGVLFDMEKCVASRQNIPLNTWSKLPPNEIVKGLLPGCDLSVYIKGFSTLYHLPHTVTLKKQSVKVFQAPSRNENMILNIVQSDDIDDEAIAKYSTLSLVDETLEETAQRLLGQSVYVNWPHMEEAKVVALSDGATEFFLHEHVTGSRGSRHKFARKDLSSGEVDKFTSEVLSIYQTQLNRHGIDVGDTKILLFAQILLGCKYICGKKGEITLEKQWSSIPQPHALQMTVKSLSVKGPTFEKITSLKDLFPNDSEIFHLNIPHYGASGKVVRIKNGTALVKLDVIKEPDLSVAIQKSQRHSTYYPGYQAAEIIGISSYLLSRITGSIYIYYPTQRKWNIGLNLKFTKEGCCIAGFTRRKNGNWLYSSALVGVLQEYLRKYPQLFEHLDSSLSKGDEAGLNAENIFGSENTSERLSELNDWLKSLPCAGGRKIKEQSSVLEKGVVDAVHEAVLDFKKSDVNTKLEVQIGVPPRFLYRPTTHQGSLIPDKHAQHCLLDRVVNVRSGYTVPLGYRGTVVGVHMEGLGEKDVMLDVLFDDEFLGGLTLGGQCPERKGYKLPTFAIINLSYGERLRDKQVDRPVAVVKPHHQEESDGGANIHRNSPEPKHRNNSLHELNNPRFPQGRFIQSPHSAFSPARKSLFRSDQPRRSPSAPRAPGSPVRTPRPSLVKNSHPTTAGPPKNQGSPDPQRSVIESRKRRTGSNPSQLNSQSCSLDQAAKWLPQVDRNLSSQIKKSSTPDVRTVPSAKLTPSSSQSRIPDQSILAASPPSKEGQKPNAQLSEALKASLKITSKKKEETSFANQPQPQSAASFNKTEGKDQIEKLLATLKVSTAPKPASSKLPEQKTFSLKDFLSNSSNEMYPIYAAGSKPILLRPDSLKPSSAASSTDQEGADRLRELLEIDNKEQKEKKHKQAWSTDDAAVKEKEIQNEIIKSDQPSEVNSNDDKNSTSSHKDEFPSPVANLAKWCTEHNLGSPMYSCYNADQTEKGNFLCAIQIPNVATFHGTPRPSKEEAIDNAASAALESLKKNLQLLSSAIPAPLQSMPQYPVPLHPAQDGKSAIPPPYFIGPPGPHFSVAGMPAPPPPLNCAPLRRDGVPFYPPTAMMPYPSYPAIHPRFYSVGGPGVVPPFLTSIPPPSQQYALPIPSVPHASRFLPPPDNHYSDNMRFMTNNKMFIPSQVINQRFSSPSKEGNINTTGSGTSTIRANTPKSSGKSPTVATNRTAKKPKGKLAISFLSPSK